MPLQVSWHHFGCLRHLKLMLQTIRLTQHKLMKPVGFHEFGRGSLEAVWNELLAQEMADGMQAGGLGSC